ncbi:hypothetical protein [Pseudorhodoferax sp.]|uniref:hypothetical protein n=1 Tax=Pseudorhodoferax sp. TaxID=1993553 RepID=UPI0039E4CFBD
MAPPRPPLACWPPVYLLALRGDPSAVVHLGMLAHEGEHTPAQEAGARAAAAQLYRELSRERAGLGLPPYDDRLPPDIRQAHEDFQRVVGSLLREALDAGRRPTPRTGAAPAAPRP